MGERTGNRSAGTSSDKRGAGESARHKFYHRAKAIESLYRVHGYWHLIKQVKATKANFGTRAGDAHNEDGLDLALNLLHEENVTLEAILRAAIGFAPRRSLEWLRVIKQAEAAHEGSDDATPPEVIVEAIEAKPEAKAEPKPKAEAKPEPSGDVSSKPVKGAKFVRNNDYATTVDKKFIWKRDGKLEWTITGISKGIVTATAKLKDGNTKMMSFNALYWKAVQS